MEQWIERLLRYRGLVLLSFLTAAAACAVMSGMVGINYDMVDYLPDEAPATVAMNQMDTLYEKAVPNLRVMIRDVSIPEALDYKQRLAAIDGVEDINWLDDQVSLLVPLEMQNSRTVADWYKDNCALFSIVVREEGQQQTLEKIRTLIGTDGAMSGNPVDTVNAQNSTNEEVRRMMLFIIPLMFGILMLTSTSWFTPVLFMLNVGLAILLNMGTNLLFGEISFITKTTGTILQLACSMDYAIFLLDRFEELRGEGIEPVRAMSKAVAGSASSILASGLTTVVGFLALVAMRFKIGPDMGYVLAKGIALSLLVTLVCLPCMILFCHKLIERTHHRSFMPSFRLLAHGTDRIKGGVTLLVLVLLIPCYLGQKQLSFMYGMSGMSGPDSVVALDRQAINGRFGESASFALMVPTGEMALERALGEQVKQMPETASVLSFVENAGSSIPAGFVPPKELKLLNAQDYTRIVIMARIPPESPETFDYVQRLRNTAEEYFPGSWLLAGECANVFDLKQTITADSVKVNLIAIGAIAVILLFTFQSLSLPLLLLLTIESSIFINVAVPYFTGQTLNYIGYLIISSVQLGATVDYAILFTNRYLENRAHLPKKQTAFQTVQDTAGSILTSCAIMTSAGLVLGLISTNGVISQLGILIARGAVLSTLLVLVLQPALLTALEGFIRRTTKNLVVCNEPESGSPAKQPVNRPALPRHRLKFVCCLLAAAALLPTIQLHAAEDVRPPVLESVVVGTRRLKGDNATYKLTVQASDDLSGIGHITVAFKNDQTGRTVRKVLREEAPAGIFTGLLEINRYEPGGTFILDNVGLTDQAGNYKAYCRPADVTPHNRKLPLPTPLSIEVRGGLDVPDEEAPVLLSLSASPGKLYTGDLLHVKAHASDALSGVREAKVQFRAGTTRLISVTLTGEQGRLSGTAPSYKTGKSGRYKLDRVTVTDRAGNRRIYCAAPGEGEEPLPDWEQVPSFLISESNNDD